jgi:diadenosine tetraphosphatase ApaH/serine/threonine PP2A family protein phosphatase
MKYAIFGDIHANLEALQAVLKKCTELRVDAYVCIGDIVGYNASPCECVDLVRSLNPVAIVKGNHDEEATNDSSRIGFNQQASQAIEWTREQLNPSQKEWLRNLPYKELIRPNITIVHATLDMPQQWGYIFDRYNAEISMNYQFTPLCFFGHTHVPVAYEKRTGMADPYEVIEVQPAHKYLINTGSVGQPRDGDWRASFVIYDTTTRQITLQRVEYDIECSMARIRDAGLPERLALRLLAGR